MLLLPALVPAVAAREEAGAAEEDTGAAATDKAGGACDESSGGNCGADVATEDMGAAAAVAAEADGGAGR